MPLFIVSNAAAPGYYDGTQLYKPGEVVFVAPADYPTKLPRAGRGSPALIPTDREGAAALGWHPERVEAAFPQPQ